MERFDVTGEINKNDNGYFIKYSDFLNYQKILLNKIQEMEDALAKSNIHIDNLSVQDAKNIEKELANFLYISDPMGTNCVENGLLDEYDIDAKLILMNIRTFINGMFPFDKTLIKDGIKWAVTKVFDDNYSPLKLDKSRVSDIVKFLQLKIGDFIHEKH